MTVKVENNREAGDGNCVPLAGLIPEAKSVELLTGDSLSESRQSPKQITQLKLKVKISTSAKISKPGLFANSVRIIAECVIVNCILFHARHPMLVMVVTPFE